MTSLRTTLRPCVSVLFANKRFWRHSVLGLIYQARPRISGSGFLYIVGGCNAKECNELVCIDSAVPIGIHVLEEHPGLKHTLLDRCVWVQIEAEEIAHVAIRRQRAHDLRLADVAVAVCVNSRKCYLELRDLVSRQLLRAFLWLWTDLPWRLEGSGGLGCSDRWLRDSRHTTQCSLNLSHLGTSSDSCISGVVTGPDDHPETPAHVFQLSWRAVEPTAPSLGRCIGATAEY